MEKTGRECGIMAEKIRVIPSIASADPLRLGEEIKRVSGWPLLHIDIEDGSFVPNITFGEKTVRAIASCAGQKLDIHILAYHPRRYLALARECGAERVAFHLEAVRYPLEILGEIRRLGMKAGLALNFTTGPEEIAVFSDALDYVIVMTAEPDGRGQQFYPPVLEKIKRLREILPENKEIWADGGIGKRELALVKEAGADTAIMGRAVFGRPV